MVIKQTITERVTKDEIHYKTSADIVVTTDGSNVEQKLSDINTSLGTKAVNTDNTRLTTDKTVTGAINELFTNANNGKQNWVDVVGSPLVNTDTFTTLKTKTQTIKDTLATNLTNKGQASVGTETLTALVDKVAQMEYITDYGTATPSTVLSGYTFLTDGGLSTGTYKYIKSMQRGTATYTNKTSLDVNITSVDLNKSIVIIEKAMSSNFSVPYLSAITAELTSPTTLNLSSNTAWGAAQYVKWTVIEFASVKLLQKGLAQIPYEGNSISVTITSVDTQKCLILTTMKSDLTTNIDAMTDLLIEGELTSNTNLYIRRKSTNAGIAMVNWQVIEFE